MVGYLEKRPQKDVERQRVFNYCNDTSALDYSERQELVERRYSPMQTT